MHTITIVQIINFLGDWVLFWSLVNIILPPREVFADESGKTPGWYNRLLMVIAYYGSLNLRQVSVKLYGVQPTSGEGKP